MIRPTLLTALLVASVAIGCRGDRNGAVDANSAEPATRRTSPRLEGTIWRFVEADGEPVVHFDNEEVPRIRFTAEGGTISAWLSCNVFAGTYETDADGGTELHIHPTPVSWRDCLEGHTQEEALRKVLQAVTSYGFDADRLVLYGDARALAVLEAIEPDH